MLFALLIIVPTAGLLLLLADRLANGDRPHPRWTAALLILAGVMAGLSAIEVLSRNLPEALRMLRGESSRTDVTWSTFLTTLAGLVGAAVFAVRGLLRQRREGVPEVRPAGFLLLLTPLLYATSILTIVLMPLLILRLLLGRLRRLRQTRLLNLLAAAAMTGSPLGEAARLYAGVPGRLSLRNMLLLHRVGGVLVKMVSARERRRLHNLADALDSGRTLPDALELSGAVPPRVIETLRAAEFSGTLSETLPRVAEEEAERNDRLPFRELLGILLYLWVLVVSSQVLIAFVQFAVAPRLQAIAMNFGLVQVQESFVEQQASQAQVLTGPAFLIGTLFLMSFAAIVLALRGSDWSSRWLNFLPRRVLSGQVLRALAEPYLAGTPIEPTVKQLGLASGHPRWARLWGDLHARITRGQPLSEALAAMRLIRPAERDALRTAGKFGTAGPVLAELGLARERRLQTLGVTLATSLRFPLLAIVGGMIVLLALGLFGYLVELMSIIAITE